MGARSAIFLLGCVGYSQLIIARKIVVSVLGQRDIATADDEDHDHIFVCSILEELKKGNRHMRKFEDIPHPITPYEV